VRGLQVHGGPVERSSAGTRTAVNLQGMEKESAPRGSVLCRPGTISPTKSAEVFVEYLPLVPKPLRHRDQISFHAGTFSCVGRILLYGQAEIPPGVRGTAGCSSPRRRSSRAATGSSCGGSPAGEFRLHRRWRSRAASETPARRGTGRTVPEALPRLRSEDPAERVLATVEDAGAAGSLRGRGGRRRLGADRTRGP